MPNKTCKCFNEPRRFLETQQSLGMDEHYAEVSLLTCPACGQPWLRVFYEVEAFSGSGRWYMGAISPEQAAGLTAEQARTALESLAWYFYGGSYYGGRSGKTSGRILLNP